LAVKTGSDVWVYDTLDHQISGFSQQQGSGGSITFGSQYGTVNLSTLPTVSRNGQPVAAAAPEPAAPVAATPAAPAPVAAAPAAAAPVAGTSDAATPKAAVPAAPVSTKLVAADDIIVAIERLAALREKGILTDEEFTAKKAELLARL
jgi:hypothetical protein